MGHRFVARWRSRPVRSGRRADRLAGAIGGVVGTVAYRQSYLSYQNGDAAVLVFIVCYTICLVVTWAVFLRRHPGRLDGV